MPLDISTGFATLWLGGVGYFAWYVISSDHQYTDDGRGIAALAIIAPLVPPLLICEWIMAGQFPSPSVMQRKVQRKREEVQGQVQGHPHRLHEYHSDGTPGETVDAADTVVDLDTDTGFPTHRTDDIQFKQ